MKQWEKHPETKMKQKGTKKNTKNKIQHKKPNQIKIRKVTRTKGGTR